MASSAVAAGKARTSHQRSIGNQFLVQFQDRTYVVNNNNGSGEHRCGAGDISSVQQLPLATERFLLEHLSFLTGWIVGALRIAQYQPPYVRITVQSRIRGGKGGFGTLLKGQSQKASAKSTTTWSACRDLQGRRLRNINDTINYQIWKEWKDKVDAGIATQDEMVKALKTTASGIEGWHLQLPSWAEGVRSSDKRLTERRYSIWKRKQQAERESARRQKEWHETNVRNYVDSAANASEQASSSLQTALQQGLELQKERHEKKRQKVEPNPPSEFVTLSGDVIVKFNMERNTWQIQSPSNFSTVGIILDHNDKRFLDNDLVLYWELVVVTGGLVQVGWAKSASSSSLSTNTKKKVDTFHPQSDSGDGVGDDACSWAYDGSRSIQLHGGQEGPFKENTSWKAGDVVGCSYDRKSGQVIFSLNGQDLGPLEFAVPPENKKCNGRPVLFPAVSANAGEIVEMRWNEADMEYLPAGNVAVGNVMGEASQDPNEEEEKKCTNAKSATQLAAEGSPTNVVADTIKGTPVQNSNKVQNGQEKQVKPLEIKALDLAPYGSAKDLERVGMDRLKGALLAVGAKCGGTLQERAERLFSLKGLKPEDYPKKVLSKPK